MRISGQQCFLLEIILLGTSKDMLVVSAKARVPVLFLANILIQEDSLSIMLWALNNHDSQQRLTPEIGNLSKMNGLIVKIYGPFKDHLYRYEHTTRYKKNFPALASRQKKWFSASSRRPIGKS